jgi:hypothetical protein
MRRLPPRWRTPAILAAVALVVLAIGAAKHGWRIVLFLPVPLVVGIFYYVNAGRDSDYGAWLRFELDERQAHHWLRVQALVARVLSLSVGIGYVVAVATKSVLWPWAVLLGLMVVSWLGGHLHYRERGAGDDAP